MAGNATGLIHSGWMTLATGRPAVINAAALFVHLRFGMSQIECRRQPARRVVARSAVCAEGSHVKIRVGMAGNAGGIQSLELTARVALFATDFDMRARQRKAGQVVVEGRAFPIIRSVTATAVCAELAVVFVILLMTGITIGRCTLENIVNVALLAFGFGVFAFEFESRKVVIEIRRLPAVG